MDWSLYFLGLMWGAVSAVSLPLGAVAGIWTRPSRRLTSGLMAFGGGALLFALSIELFGHALHVASDEHLKVTRPGIVISAILAAILGGLLFRGLNHLLNSKGGYRRKRGLIKQHIVQEKQATARRLLKDLSRIALFSSLPPEEFVRLLSHVEIRRLDAGSVVFREGEEGDRLYCVLEGTIRIHRADSGAEVASLGPGEVFGEIALLSDLPRTASAEAKEDVRLAEIRRTEFDRLLEAAPALASSVKQMAEERIRELAGLRTSSPEEATRWEEEAITGLSRLQIHTSDAEVAEEAAHGSGAALTIWLGIALDGIPESLVIGLLVVVAAAENTSISLALIAGVFLANLPEAMSSSVTMRDGGMSKTRVFWMWMSLCIMTGIGAFIGAMVFPPHPEGGVLLLIYAIEGLAGGAMLTMIAETMLPEAFEQGGGPLVGLSTLAGFLAALAVKLLR